MRRRALEVKRLALVESRLRPGSAQQSSAGAASPRGPYPPEPYREPPSAPPAPPPRAIGAAPRGGEAAPGDPVTRDSIPDLRDSTAASAAAQAASVLRNVSDAREVAETHTAFSVALAPARAAE